MRNEGKIKVVVRSRRVPIGTFVHTVPVYSASGVLVGYRPDRRILYGTSLNDGHRRTIEEAQKLASNLGLDLEVVDRSGAGFLRRFLSWFGWNGAPHPSILISPPRSLVATDPRVALSHGC